MFHSEGYLQKKKSKKKSLKVIKPTTTIISPRKMLIIKQKRKKIRGGIKVLGQQIRLGIRGLKTTTTTTLLATRFVNYFL